MYNKRVGQHHSCIFAILVGTSIYFLWEAKYVSTIFLCLNRPAKIYIQLNLHKVSIMQVRELLYYVVIYGLPDYTIIFQSKKWQDIQK